MFLKRNLSKSRFLLALFVALFFVLVLAVQFVVLSVYRAKEQSLKEHLNDLDKQIELIKQPTDDEKNDYAHFEEGYSNPDDKVFVQK